MDAIAREMFEYPLNQALGATCFNFLGQPMEYSFFAGIKNFRRQAPKTHLGSIFAFRRGWPLSSCIASLPSRHARVTTHSFLGLFKTTPPTNTGSAAIVEGLRACWRARRRWFSVRSCITIGAACQGGALGGSDPASDLHELHQRSYNIAAWKHLEAREGQFGAAYKASLINLGLFQDADQEVDEEVGDNSEELSQAIQDIELTELSERGRKLADAFEKSIHGTRYAREGWAKRDAVRADVLKEFGSRADYAKSIRKAPKIARRSPTSCSLVIAITSSQPTIGAA